MMLVGLSFPSCVLIPVHPYMFCILLRGRHVGPVPPSLVPRLQRDTDWEVDPRYVLREHVLGAVVSAP